MRLAATINIISQSLFQFSLFIHLLMRNIGSDLSFIHRLIVFIDIFFASVEIFWFVFMLLHVRNLKPLRHEKIFWSNGNDISTSTFISESYFDDLHVSRNRKKKKLKNNIQFFIQRFITIRAFLNNMRLWNR